MMTIRTAVAVLLSAAATGFAGVPIPQRDVQFRSIDLTTNVMEIHNFGAGAMSLAGWRFCSHSNAQTRRYTNAAALNAVTLNPGESMFIYLNNDSPGGALNFNATAIGTFANNFGQGPYAIALFWPNGGSISFASIEDMVDHIQWNVNGITNAVADERSQQAVNAGLWTAATDWISTSGNSLSIGLIPAGGELHGPSDYAVAEPPMGPCNPADVAEPFGILDLADIGAFVTAFTTSGALADLAAPFGVLDLSDINVFVTSFVAGCP